MRNYIAKISYDVNEEYLIEAENAGEAQAKAEVLDGKRIKSWGGHIIVSNVTPTEGPLSSSDK